MNEVKAILPYESDGRIMEALRLRFYDVEKAVQYLMPSASSSSSVFSEDSRFSYERIMQTPDPPLV